MRTSTSPYPGYLPGPRSGDGGFRPGSAGGGRSRRPGAERRGTRGRPKRTRPKDPLWTKLIILFGALVMVGSGLSVAVPKLAAAWFTDKIEQIDAIPDELQGTDISGPINFLLLGLDQRDGEEAEPRIRADSIVLVHIPAAHDRVFMISLPRDAWVEIPPYPKTEFAGGSDKINAAFAHGAVTPDIWGERDPSKEGRTRGAELTMLTISNLVPGGLRFNGVAIINFDGFDAVVEALGTVDMCVDTDTYSIHYLPNGERAWPDLDLSHGEDQTVGKHYPIGCYPMQPWEALDYSRQRHIPDGDYGRQRHQQQLMKAIVKKAMRPDTITNFGTIVDLQEAAGDLLTLDLGGNSLEDWVLTLSSLRADDIIMIKTNGGKFTSELRNDIWYEYLSDESLELLKSVQTDTVGDFLIRHSDWVASDR